MLLNGGIWPTWFVCMNKLVLRSGQVARIRWPHTIVCPANCWSWVSAPLWTEEYYKYVTDSLNVRQILERRVCGICGDNIILGTRLPLCTTAKEEGPKRISSSSSYSWPQSMRTESRRTDCVEFVIVAVFMQKVTSYNNAVLHSSDDDHWPLWPGGGCDGMGIFAGTDCGQRQLQPVRQRKQ